MPIRSNYPDVDLRECDIFSFLFDRTDREFPDHKVIFQDANDTLQPLTFADVRGNAIDFGKALRDNIGLQTGDVIALFTPNSIDVPCVILGALWAGAIVSPSNPGYTATELEYQLRDSGAKYLVTHISILPLARQVCSKVGISDSHIFLVGRPSEEKTAPKHWTLFRSNKAWQENQSPARQLRPKEDLAFLSYSSGTTGKPKGVQLTHYNVTANIQQMRGQEPVSWDGSITVPNIPNAPKSGDKILACLPFFHIYGLTCLMINPLYTGVHCVLMERFDIESWCQVVDKHRITVGYIVPPIVLLLCKHPAVEKYDLSSLRICSSGAAPLTRELVEAAFARKKLRVKQGYGMTETSPTLFAMRWQDWRDKVGTTGLLVPNMLAKFCTVPEGENEGAVELPRGELGELYVMGPNIFKGYYKNPAATMACLHDDWFRTGDIGFMDSEGNLTITDRAKELIKYKGSQVAPAELEGVLVDHELVDDAAVIGVPLPGQGTEGPRAYIVRKGGMSAVRKGDEDKIHQWLNSRVANYKKLRGGIVFVDTIPKSPSGKILRRVLKDSIKKELQQSDLRGKL
ncbi:uncharacterized protein Z518_03511 [Rhinocladiella mackenziei CBS 650.93]|uniref:Phenylacetyl-CoA ligase n=1 Tax=Rhinocladiella mackenziei CBS 650.93 TaxID=1442369 RepID=A0A0D2IS74_9EURO|nr:uncharacterized protein Z518_03511 [Rhinocladiella mackenziei CBS 650.93]KIX08854.1 hypothetical protein Z518_03511 [Rhinocladiella mackenziei CBS 650.93]